MRIEKYWHRFMQIFEKEFNTKFPLQFVAEFFKDGKKFKVRIDCYEVEE